MMEKIQKEQENGLHPAYSVKVGSSIVSVKSAEDARRMLQSPEKTDIPRRIEAMRRLQEKWKTVPEFASIGTILKLAGRVDMNDWDKRELAA